LSVETGDGAVEGVQRRLLPDVLKWAFAMSWGERAVGSIFTFLLAALLGPHDFGVVAMALVYIALAHVFLEQGIGTALIQRRDLEPDHLHAAFWLNLVWCVGLAGVTVAVSGWWAELNGAPVLRDVLAVLSLMLVLEGLIIVQEAQLQRSGGFKRLALAANLAALGGGLLGVALALAGAGVWALVAQQLAASAIALVLIWAMSAWRPRLRFSRSHARDLLGFSLHVFAANLGGFVNRRSDTLLVGVVFGPVVVGIYRLADRLVDFVLELTTRPLGLVALPLFARLERDREELRSAVETCLRLTLIAVVPTLLLVAASSDLLLGVFGAEWELGADALKLLAVVGIGKAVVSFTGPLLFALGRPGARAIMLWMLGSVSAATVVGVSLGLRGEDGEQQLLGVSVSRALLFLLVFVPVNLAVIRATTDLGVLRFLSLARAPVAAGAAAAGAVVLLRVSTGVDRLPAVAALLASVLPALVVGLAILLALEPRARAYVPGLRPARSGAG
jgi:teichuronic acid exporter